MKNVNNYQLSGAFLVHNKSLVINTLIDIDKIVKIYFKIFKTNRL